MHRFRCSACGKTEDVLGASSAVFCSCRGPSVQGKMKLVGEVNENEHLEVSARIGGSGKGKKTTRIGGGSAPVDSKKKHNRIVRLGGSG